MINRVKIDATLPPCCTDYLFEIEPDVPDDGRGKFLEDAGAAGAMNKMSSDVAHRHVAALAEESAERTARFAKRFDAGGFFERVEKVGQFEMRYRGDKLISAREIEGENE
jgi:hypothetical protein